jgi:hypothetical protein
MSSRDDKERGKERERERSTARSVHLRDRLWRTYEIMSEEQEKSVDDLVNDALAAYAQLAGYDTSSSGHEGVSAIAVTPVSTVLPSPAASAASIPPRPPPSSGPPLPGPLPIRGGRPPSMPSLPHAGDRPLAVPPPVEGLAAGHATLYLVFDNQRYRIDKEQFIIGRGSKSSDLPIKDGNISRKHAAVIRRNGTYFIKDLGSTNGIDFKGMRIDNKRIDEGDVFSICEYELKFTYKR